MSQASQDSSGHFLSTRADRVIRSKCVGSHHELAFPNVCRTAVRYITSNITSHHLAPLPLQPRELLARIDAEGIVKRWQPLQ